MQFGGENKKVRDKGRTVLLLHSCTHFQMANSLFPLLSSTMCSNLFPLFPSVYSTLMPSFFSGPIQCAQEILDPKLRLRGLKMTLVRH